MKITTRNVCCVWLPMLLLALFLAFSPLSLQSNVQARAEYSTLQSNALPEQASSKVIEVSLAKQWLYAYQNGRVVFSTAVMTGRPGLGTPRGTYYVFNKLSPTTFTSPF